MWQYLARNFKTDLNILVLLNLWVYRETGAVTQRSFNHQTGMDFVTEISFCKTPVIDEKRLVFRGWESAREII